MPRFHGLLLLIHCMFNSASRVRLALLLAPPLPQQPQLSPGEHTLRLHHTLVRMPLRRRQFPRKRKPALDLASSLRWLPPLVQSL